MSKLYLIRHAQASFLADDYDNLSDHGRKQSRILGKYLLKSGVEFDEVYVGPLRRHIQTLEEVQKVYRAEGLTVPEPIEFEELDEYNGIETLKTMRHALAENHEEFRVLFSEMEASPNHKTKMKMVVAYLKLWVTDSLGFDLPEGTQSWAEFRDTAQRGLAKVVEGNEKGKTVGVVSSGGCISAMLGKVLEMTDPEKTIGFNLVMLNTAISEVLFSGGTMSLKNFNTLPHLSEDLVTTM